MKKSLTLFLIIVITPLIGGLYGIVHDQLTYTISPEYYTKFKFYQFGLMDMGDEAIFPNPRVQVSMVGFMATWWVGIIIGIILGAVGLIHKNGRQMFSVTMRAVLLTIVIAFVTGLVGLAIGEFYLDGTARELGINVVDVKNYVAVGCMHNFSYLGGLIGLIAGVIYSIRQKRKYLQKEMQERSR